MADQELRGPLADDPWARLVEAFLASPMYGERWGRHWLDIVGYADSNGYFNADSERPLAWQYRDYVVRAFNADRPFDRFVLEQVAKRFDQFESQFGGEPSHVMVQLDRGGWTVGRGSAFDDVGI